MQDFGEATLRSDHAHGYVRVDWYTPQGLPTWGDGRLVILGTEGYIELRKYVDVAGRPGRDHLFVVDGAGTEYVDCSDVELSYYPDLVRDVVDRTETACPQAAHLRGDAAGDRRPSRARRRAGFARVTRAGRTSGRSGSGSSAAARSPGPTPSATRQPAGRAGRRRRHHPGACRRTTPRASATTAYGSMRASCSISSPTWCRSPRRPAATPRSTVELLERGRSVLLEKPPATNLADMDILAAAEAASAGSVYVVFQHRHGSGARRAHELLRSGALGTPRVAVCETLWYRPDSYFLPEWRGNWAGEGGGPTLGHGIHQIDLLLHLMGPVGDRRRPVGADRPPGRVRGRVDGPGHVQQRRGGHRRDQPAVPARAQPDPGRHHGGTLEVNHVYGYRDADWSWTPAPDATAAAGLGRDPGLPSTDGAGRPGPADRRRRLGRVRRAWTSPATTRPRSTGWSTTCWPAGGHDTTLASTRPTMEFVTALYASSLERRDRLPPGPDAGRPLLPQPRTVGCPPTPSPPG